MIVERNITPPASIGGVVTIRESREKISAAVVHSVVPTWPCSRGGTNCESLSVFEILDLLVLVLWPTGLRSRSPIQR